MARKQITTKTRRTTKKTSSKTTSKKPVMTPEQKESLAKELSRQFVSYHFDIKEAMESDKITRFVMAKDGMMQVRQNEIGTFVSKATKVPGADEIKESFKMQLPKKIPYEIFLQTLTFFRNICDKMNDAEAMIQVFWDRKQKEYLIHVPKQKVTGASVKFDRDSEFEKEKLLVVDIHSHNNMSAFFSATDNGDEKETRLFGVIGKVKTETPEFLFRAICGGEEIPLTIWDIFESPFPDVAIPSEWYDKVEKEVFVPKEYKGYQAGLFPNQQHYYGKETKTHLDSSVARYKEIESLSDMDTDIDDDYTLHMMTHLNSDIPYDLSEQEQTFLDSAINTLSEDGITALVSLLADYGYERVIQTALHSK